MKKYALLIICFFFIVGCSNNLIGESGDLIDDNGERGSGSWLGWWKGLGEFYLMDRTEKLGSYQTGPLKLDIKAAQLVKGNFNKSEDELMPEEHSIVNLIIVYNMDIDYEKHEEVKFDNSFLHIITDKGEKAQFLEGPSSFMKTSNIIDQTVPFSTNFKLKETSIDEVNSFTLYVQSPQNRDGEPLGDDLEIEIEF